MMCFLIFWCLILFCDEISGANVDCPTVPDGCPRDQIKYFLYTTFDWYPHELVLENVNSVARAPFISNAPVKFIFHGYEQSKDNVKIKELREAYLLQFPVVNIITIDYPTLAQNKCYINTSSKSVPQLGRCSAQLIEIILQQRNDVPFEQFNFIGFSLGAHISAHTSNNLKPKLVEKIHGLDPAFPLFFPLLKPDNFTLNRDHAKFVEVFHTNVLLFGTYYSSAHYEIFVNYGLRQPDCHNGIGCSHGRALDYFTESIITRLGFWAVKCMHLNFVPGIGFYFGEDFTNTILVGEYAMPPRYAQQEGLYMLSTNRDPPFARGKPYIDYQP